MKLIYEKSKSGRRGIGIPRPEGLAVPEVPEELRRKRPPRLPELAEPEVLRHFTELSTRNFGIDTGFYPLGSCTMKYNPRVNERLVGLPGFARLHPLARIPALVVAYVARITGNLGAVVPFAAIAAHRLHFAAHALATERLTDKQQQQQGHQAWCQSILLAPGAHVD